MGKPTFPRILFAQLAYLVSDDPAGITASRVLREFGRPSAGLF
jgi:hypothetical protein